MGATKRGKNGVRGGEGKVVPGRGGWVALFQNEREAEEVTHAVIIEVSSAARRKCPKDSEKLEAGCGFSAGIFSINDSPSVLDYAAQKGRAMCQPL